MEIETNKHRTVLLKRDEAHAFHRIARLEGMREPGSDDFDRARAAFARAGKLGEGPIVFATKDSGATIPQGEVDTVADRTFPTFPSFERSPQHEETAEQAG